MPSRSCALRLQVAELANHPDVRAFLSPGSDTYACSDEPPSGVSSRHASTSNAQSSPSAVLLAGLAHLPGAADAAGKGSSRSSSFPGAPDACAEADCAGLPPQQPQQPQQLQQQAASAPQQPLQEGRQQPASPVPLHHQGQQQEQLQQQSDSPVKGALLSGPLAKGYQSIAQSLASLGAGVAQLAGVNSSSTAAAGSALHLRSASADPSPGASPTASPSAQQAQLQQQHEQARPAATVKSAAPPAASPGLDLPAGNTSGSSTSQALPDSPLRKQQADARAAAASAAPAAASAAQQQPGVPHAEALLPAAAAAAAAAADCYSEAVGGLTGPLYQLVDTVFELQLRGFFRRQVSSPAPPAGLQSACSRELLPKPTTAPCPAAPQVLTMARQALSLIAGDALDVWLLQQIRAVFSEHTVARALLSVQAGLWPGGEWYAYASSSTSSRGSNGSGSNSSNSSSSSPRKEPGGSKEGSSSAAASSAAASSYRTSPGMLPEAYLDYTYDEAEAQEVADKVCRQLWRGCTEVAAAHCHLMQALSATSCRC
jgi:hypothetical protein